MAEFGVLDLTLGPIEADLALDEALLIEAEESDGPPLLRTWESPGPAVVLGASGRIAEDVRLVACRLDGVPIARRSSGGGAVVVGPGALCVSVILPRDFAPGLESVDLAQSFVLERIAASLRSRGPEARVLGSGDLTLGGRKFAGSAQRRLKRYFLIHASVLYDFPLDLIARYLAEPRRRPSYREGRTHAEFLVNVPLPRGDLVGAVRRAWLGVEGPPPTLNVPHDRVRALLAEKFADRAWIERL
jgi:lipoate-protein ligase A